MTNTNTPQVKVGDIYVATGGYDANYAFFYKIAKVTEKSARLVPIGSKVVTPGRNCMEHGAVVADETAPAPANRRAKTCRIKISGYKNEPYFKVDSCFCPVASKWNGQPINTYNYH